MTFEEWNANTKAPEEVGYITHKALRAIRLQAWQAARAHDVDAKTERKEIHANAG